MILNLLLENKENEKYKEIIKQVVIYIVGKDK